MIRDDLSLLEYPRILEIIAGYAHSEPTRELILSQRPAVDRDEIDRRFALFSEIEFLHHLDIPLRLDEFPDIRPVLDLVRPAGSILNPPDLLVLLQFLRVVTGLSRQIAYRTDIPCLLDLLGGLNGCEDLGEAIDGAIDGGGEIRDTASASLAAIRERKRSLTARIRKRLEEIVREREVAIFLQDDFITQRSGRWVIPVRMDSKGMVPGVVHDVSNTGETAFVEPVEIVPLANELENLTAEERAEMIRILRRLTSWIRESAEILAEDFRLLVAADFHNSVARFALSVKGIIPRIGSAGELCLKGGRHPLLALREGERVVPLDISLDRERRVLVITGPNTGGKTVALKTVGLLTLLALTGIPIPAGDGTRIPFVDRILTDIGDDQSIESSLSTFSSHISRISRILRESTDESLVLIDELGTGTEPAQGGALSCAILEALRDRGAFVLATTHLTPITAFVHREEGMENASMLFDPVNLTPTYMLRVGTPGGSHAFETARRHGIPDEVIQRALTLADDLSTRFHELLDELSREIASFRERSVRLEIAERQLEGRMRDLREREEEQERRERESRARAIDDARHLISETRRRMNEILEEMRRERSRRPMERLAEVERELDEAIRELRPSAQVDIDSLAPGSMVQIRSLGMDAPVLSVDRKSRRLRVSVRGKELDLPLDAVAPPSGRRFSHPARHRGVPDAEESPTTLSVIGRRVEEALPLVERFIDEGVMRGRGELRIVHGKGTGLLRKGIREYLATHPHVAAFRDGEPFEGGSGMTVVTLG